MLTSATGIKEAAENDSSSTEEAIIKEKEMLAKFFGADPKDLEKDQGMAMLQAGLQAIDSGSLTGALTDMVGNLSKINKSARKDKLDITKMAVQNVLGREATKSERNFIEKTAETERKFDFRKLQYKSGTDIGLFNAKINHDLRLARLNNAHGWRLKDADIQQGSVELNSRIKMAADKIISAENIANNANLSATNRATAENEAAYQRKMIGNLSAAQTMVYTEAIKLGKTGEQITAYMKERLPVLSKFLTDKEGKSSPGDFHRIVSDAATSIYNASNDNVMNESLTMEESFGQAERAVAKSVAMQTKYPDQTQRILNAIIPDASAGTAVDSAGETSSSSTTNIVISSLAPEVQQKYNALKDGEQIKNNKTGSVYVKQGGNLVVQIP